MVDPDEHLLEQHVLEGNAYRLEGRHAASVVFRGLDGVEADLAKVW